MQTNITEYYYDCTIIVKKKTKQVYKYFIIVYSDYEMYIQRYAIVK